jgi:hypothetical protein
MEIDLDKFEKAGVPQEVRDVYKRVKRDLITDEDRKTWNKLRTRCWNAAYPLDPQDENSDSIWTAKEREQMIAAGQIPVAVNDLARDIQGSSALITSRNPGLQFAPIGSGDLYVAELLKRAWDYVVNSNEGAITFFDFIKEKNIGNLAVIEAYHDPSMGIFGKILIEDRDPTTYYFDKKSRKRDHSDVSFGKAHQVTKTYALETYDALTEEDLIFTELRKEDKEGDTPDGKPGQDAYAVDTNEKPGDRPDEKEPENVWEIEDWELKKETEIWVMVADANQPFGFTRKIFKSYADVEKDGWVLAPDKKTAADAIGISAAVWKRKVVKRVQRIIVGKKLISKQVNPLGTDSEGMPVLSIITLIEDRTLNGYPTGKTARALESSRLHNKSQMQARLVISRNLDAPLAMTEGCKWMKDPIHGDWIQVGKDVQSMPQRVMPGSTSAELVNMIQINKQDIHDEYQINDVTQGKIPAGQSNIAHGTILSLQEMVGVISSPGVLAFESSLVKLGKAVIALCLMCWPRPLWMRLIEPEEMTSWQPDKEKNSDPLTGKPLNADEMAKMAPEMKEQREQGVSEAIQMKWKDALDKITGDNGKEKISPLDVDVKVIAGSTQPTNRMAKAGQAIEMKNAGLYGPKTALKYIDDPLKDEAIEEIEAQSANQTTEGKFNISVSVKSEDLPPGALAQVLAKGGIQIEQPQVGTAGATPNEMMQSGAM